MTYSSLRDSIWACGLQQLPSLTFADILGIDAAQAIEDQLEVQ